jgi:hypothetical protein
MPGLQHPDKGQHLMAPATPNPDATRDCAAYLAQQPAGIEEHGHVMSGGGIHTWNPDTYDVYPLDRRIEHGKRHGGHVVRRRIIVLDDWEEI